MNAIFSSCISFVVFGATSKIAKAFFRLVLRCLLGKQQEQAIWVFQMPSPATLGISLQVL